MEPEPEPELDEALLLSTVRRAVVLEETGRPEEALRLYEQAYAAFKAAGQQRGKLVRRIINCRCRLSGEEQGVVVQGDATALDADASLDALRARRIGERAHEQQHAATRIQSRFRGNRWRWEKRMLAQTATRIQSCWRGRQAREKVDLLRSVRAGLRIQSFIRARKARQELRQTNPLLARKLRDSGGNIHSPEEALAAFNQASTMLRKGETSDEMVELYMRAVELGFERRNRCFNGAGMVRCKQDRSREGYDFFSQATAFDQHDSRAWHNRANAAFDLGDIQQAHADASRARMDEDALALGDAGSGVASVLERLVCSQRGQRHGKVPEIITDFAEERHRLEVLRGQAS